MLKKCCWLLLLLCPMVGFTQTIRTATSLTYTRLAGYSTQASDAFSFSANLGALAQQKDFSVGVYSERRFLLKDLSAYATAAALPTSSGNFGLKADYVGSSLYNESVLGLAYARHLGSRVSLGVQFNYLNLKAEGYGTASTVNVDAGVMFHLTPQLNAGLQVYNPVGSAWGKEGTEKLPAIYTAGVGYDASPQVFIGVEAEKAEDQPVSINAGMQYRFAEKLTARAGIRSATSLYYLGFGVQVKAVRVDVTASVHSYLGVTPGLLLLYSGKK